MKTFLDDVLQCGIDYPTAIDTILNVINDIKVMFHKKYFLDIVTKVDQKCP